MADETTDAYQVGDQQETEQDIRMARFKALGGGTTVDYEVKKLSWPKPDSPRWVDLITDKHRELVKSLAMGGLSHEKIAKIIGMPKKCMQDAFEWELDAAFDMAETTLGRSLYLKGVAGDTWAALSWLRYHKNSQWGEKRELTDKGAQQEQDINAEQTNSNQDFLAKLLGEIAVDPNIKKPAREHSIQAAPEPVKIAAPKPKSMKRAKGD